MGMRNKIFTILFAPLLATIVGFADSKKPIEIGILPYLDTKELIRLYQPLANNLKKEFDREFLIMSAKDYKAFVEMTANRSYDIIITDPHLGRLAELQDGYAPILRPKANCYVEAVVLEESSVFEVGGLKNKTIAAPHKLAQTTIIGKRILKEYNLNPHTDLRFINRLDHRNALLALSKGEADAAIVSSLALIHAKSAVPQKLRILPQTYDDKANKGEMPMIYMLSPNLDKELGKSIKISIEKFANNDPKGKEWIDKLKHEGVREPNLEELLLLDSYMDDLKEGLE